MVKKQMRMQRRRNVVSDCVICSNSLLTRSTLASLSHFCSDVLLHALQRQLAKEVGPLGAPGGGGATGHCGSDPPRAAGCFISPEFLLCCWKIL